MIVSTDQLYGMTQNSGDHVTRSRRPRRSRLPPVLSSAAMLEESQCEVAFPGNRILSPAPAESAQPKPVCPLDMHRTDVNDDESTSELSEDDHVLNKLPPTPWVTELRDVNTSTADSNSSNSPSLRHSQLTETYTIAERMDNKSADCCGIYMENGDLNAVPLEPLKAEELATFGNGVIVIS